MRPLVKTTVRNCVMLESPGDLVVLQSSLLDDFAKLGVTPADQVGKIRAAAQHGIEALNLQFLPSLRSSHCRLEPCDQLACRIRGGFGRRNGTEPIVHSDRRKAAFCESWHIGKGCH